MPIKSDREYRDMTIEVRTAETEEPDSRMMVRGYASTFNQPYTLYENDNWRFDEVVDRDAFSGADMSDVIMQYDHQGRVFARISNNTLSVTPDERGLLIEADLSGTELGRQLYEEIRGGYTNKMSFGFTVGAEDVLDTKADDGKALTVRTIKAVRKLYDVSAVSLPANDATEISVRTLTDGEIARLEAERLEAEKRAELERRREEVRARALSGGKNE